SNSWLPEIFLFGGKFFGGKLADYSEVIVKVLLNFGILTISPTLYETAHLRKKERTKSYFIMKIVCLQVQSNEALFTKLQ
uniref:Uncharacterized protein n=1 Tax=Romanomermis culicivorax TaxID=13658 RepID=A0A915J923_ROMCU